MQAAGQPNPMELLGTIQHLVANKKYKEAIDVTNKLLTECEIRNKSIPLLFKTTCHMELKEYEECVKGCEELLKCEEIYSAEELAPGCWSTHEAAFYRLAGAYDAMGNKTKSDEYKKKLTEHNKLRAGNIEKAVAFKDEGNALYKAGKYAEALTKYEGAIRLDASSPTIWSNICQTHIKLKNYQKAMLAADQCIRINPEWPKGWYRKGTVLQLINRPVEAVQAFQQGLQLAPNDADLRKAYMEASRQAEKVKEEVGGLNKKFMGMMMEIKHNSLDIAKWNRLHRSRSKIWTHKSSAGFSWDKDIVPHLSDAKLRSKITRIMRNLMPDYQDFMVPFNLYDANVTDQVAFTSYVIPQEPLLSLLILHTIFSHVQPNDIDDWVFVFGLTYLPEDLASHPVYPFISSTRIYAGLLGGTDKCTQEGVIVDLWSTVEAQAFPDQADAGRWWNHFVETISAEKKEEEEAGPEKPFAYTLDDFDRMLEFVGSYYKARSIPQQQAQQNGQSSYNATMEDVSDSDSEHIEKPDTADVLLPPIPSSSKSNGDGESEWKLDSNSYIQKSPKAKSPLQQGLIVTAILIAAVFVLQFMNVVDFTSYLSSLSKEDL